MDIGDRVGLQVVVPACPPTPCREWRGARDPNGYGRFRHGSRTHLVHRWVYSRVNGGLRAIRGKDVMHLCDNPPCYRYDHLYLGTRQNNVDDMISKGRDRYVGASLPGERHPQAKLNDLAVVEIRQAYADGESQGSIAQRFGLNQSTVSLIVTRKRWSHVP